jgi:uncharacterized damage-inducible protein DinB
MKTARQTTFLQRLAQAKERLFDSFAGLDQETLCTACVVGDWTVKDILGHIVSWDKEYRASIEAILQGKHPGYERQISEENDFGAWNQQQLDQKRNWSWERIRAEVDLDFEQAEELILRLRPQDFRQRGVTPWKPAAVARPPEPTKQDTDSVETLVTYHWRHTNSHVREIEKWRRRKEKH